MGDGFEDHEPQGRAAGLLVQGHRRQEFVEGLRRVRDRQPERGQHPSVPIGGLGVEQAGGVGQFGSEHHADADPLPVAAPVVLAAFDRVSEGVAVVQQFPAHPVAHRGALPQVGADHSRLDRDAALDEFAQHRGGRIEAGLRRPLDQGEDLGVGDEPGLDHLGHPGTKVVDGQGVQQVGVADHADRLEEGADQVLSGRGVDAGLPTDGGVHHPQQGGRYGDQPDPAQPTRRDEAGQVGGAAPAHADDQVGTGEARLAEPVPHLHQHGRRLGLLGVRHADHQDLVPGVPQPGGEFLGQGVEGRRVQQGHPLGVLGQLDHVPTDPGADPDLVRVVRPDLHTALDRGRPRLPRLSHRRSPSPATVP